MRHEVLKYGRPKGACLIRLILWEVAHFWVKILKINELKIYVLSDLILNIRYLMMKETQNFTCKRSLFSKQT